MKNKEELEKKTGIKHFSICLQNPPYDKGLCDKFFAEVLKISDKVITIQPMTWVFGKKQNKNIIKELENSKCDITIVNPKEFDAGFLSRVSINFVDNTKEKEVTLYNELNNKYRTYNDISEVTELSLDDELSEFNNLIYKLYTKDNLQNHSIAVWKNQNEKIINDNLPCIRYVGIRGHGIGSDNKHNPDFYTIISNNKKEQQEKVLISGKDLLDKTKKIPFVFVLNNKKEQMGLFNYLQTDFCRASLATIKFNQHLDSGELKHIPWFDFSQDIFSKSPREIDDYLFKKYNISDKIRKHIEEILPDYYNIRK